ncbi:MAG TPA: alkaline phosphatase family protein, partial [Candidatus Acidoferrum sp.]|nr:alkaline phosphatase family protein [Candidatus Acidoferrum sp.]
GTSSFTIQVADSAGNKGSAGFSITISLAAGGGNAPFGHIVIVLEENTNYASVVGTTAMPYLNTLISRYGLATQYYATTHPSIGNYMDLTTGQILTNDDSQTPTTFPVSQDNVVRELVAAGKTWKAYGEDLPSVGYTGGDNGNFAIRHYPLAYYGRRAEQRHAKTKPRALHAIRDRFVRGQFAQLFLDHPQLVQ